jgi:LacI family transcriptional regulator
VLIETCFENQRRVGALSKGMTIYDLAQKLGLSVSTTSKALNGYTDVKPATRERVLTAAKEMGFEPSAAARSITTKRSYLIGVIYQDLGGGLMNPHFSEILEHFRRTVEALGYQIMFVSVNDRTLLQNTRWRGLDGVVVMSYDEDSEQLDELLSTPIPAVLTDFDHGDCASVFSDNQAGMEVIVNYLWGMGHRNYCYVSTHLNHTSGRERFEGVRDALARRGIAEKDFRVVNATGHSYLAGYRVGEELLSREMIGAERSLALITASDQVAFGLCSRLKENGISVPKDVSVTGFDDLSMEETNYWQLTTLRQQRMRIGQEAGKLLVRQIQEGAKDSLQIRLPVTLVERGSVRRLLETDR